MYATAIKTASSKNADFRSDTVTRPDEGMMAAIQSAALGDDVYGDDPTTATLEAAAAALLGKEAGLFLPSGTQSNLAGVMAHCNRGDEYLIGKTYHIYSYEAGGTAVLGSVMPHPLPVNDRGALAADDVIAAIKPDDSHTPITRLLCIENTVSGMAQSQSYMDEMANLAHDHGLKAHCDGARLMNAAVALGVSAKDLVRGYDTVSLCLSKGLGAPAGSVLVGDHETIARARRLRKMLGGGMRQSGLLAAAGLYALEHNIDDLAEDHRRARHLVEQLNGLDGITVTPEAVETNMVFIRFGDEAAIISDKALAELGQFMSNHAITITPSRVMRCVVHRDISDADIDALIHALRAFIERYAD